MPLRKQFRVRTNGFLFFPREEIFFIQFQCGKLVGHVDVQLIRQNQTIIAGFSPKDLFEPGSANAVFLLLISSISLQ